MDHRYYGWIDMKSINEIWEVFGIKILWLTANFHTHLTLFQQSAVKSDGNEPVDLCGYVDFMSEVQLNRAQ